MRNRTKYIMLFIIGILLGFSTGMYIGAYTMLTFAVDKGLEFINMNGANITIDTGDLIQGIWRYQNQIG